MGVRFSLPQDRRIAMSFVVNVEEGAEQNISAGDKGPEPVDELGVSLKIPVRNYANESNYLYGITAGAPRVMRLLDQYGFTCTFTAAAVALEKAPDLARAIAAGGHEVCSHGHRWVHQFSFKEERERAFIRQATESLRATTGARPLGWLSRYLFTENTRRLLIEEGYFYHMDDFGDDVPRWDLVDVGGAQRGIVIVPYAIDTNDMKMWVAPAYSPAQWLEYAVDSFDQLYEEGAAQPRIMSLGVHLRIIGRPGRIGALAKFMQHVASRKDVWVTSRLAIAQHFAALNPL
ncbi:polysaccharide deacetylase family protein [Vineibacter terrae]|uniref:Chitooligosaccharide deacetylase n=1 Tax=Vineibacter terrae TaxID=2586908 RepID=A0A5C8PP11_9HYPH|nr:polysaccharide deacetylase family protein [Vineibacter terrae]TXL76426.1 allantoinase [Vineibacter terrae]HEX2891982.1 polysaccharide deacetylase family protein [Vineibacter terrae]